MSVLVRAYTGDDVTRIIPELSRLRVTIFADFPYLYEGSAEYEAEYLSVYARSEGAIVVVAEDDGKIVGASTGIPLSHEPESLRRTFEEHGYDVGSIFYGGESVLSPSHRGQKIYGRFLAAREEHARALGMSLLTFCAVERAPDHPLRPEGYVPLDGVWKYFGYAPRPELRAVMRWRDRGDAAESDHAMSFWTKTL